MTTPCPDPPSYLQHFRGSFVNLLRWPQLDALWDTLRSQTHKAWYLYAVGEAPPETPADDTQLVRFVEHMDALLRREHDEDYCGIVYVDDRDDPRMIKIYDPNNLGSVCGSSGAPPPLPGWVLSLERPVALSADLFLPAGRKRWWRRLWGGG